MTSRLTSRHVRSPLRRMPRPTGNKSSRSHTRVGNFGDPIQLECLSTRPEMLGWSANSFSPGELGRLIRSAFREFVKEFYPDPSATSRSAVADVETACCLCE